MNQVEIIEIQNRIERELGLTYVDISGSNLCFIAQNEDLQDAFKLYFTASDFQQFLHIYKNRNYEFPTSKEEFWEMVKKGRKF